MPSRKFHLTTEHTKATKVSDIVIYKLLNFVLFVTFVVKVAFFLWLRLCRARIFVVIKYSSLLVQLLDEAGAADLVDDGRVPEIFFGVLLGARIIERGHF